MTPKDRLRQMAIQIANDIQTRAFKVKKKRAKLREELAIAEAAINGAAAAGERAAQQDLHANSIAH